MNSDGNMVSVLRQLTTNILVSGRIWRGLAQQALAETGLGSNAAFGLFWISHVGDGAKQIEIATEMGLTPAALVRMIDQLESLGLVRRQVDDLNRRANRIWLTEYGTHIVSRIHAILDDIQGNLFGNCDASQISSANTLFRSIMTKKE